MKSQNKVSGNKGEDIAARFLRNKGYRIVMQNFRTKNGEIDIIATKNDTLVFVEVKTRLTTEFGTPLEAITPRKVIVMTRTAEYFKSSHRDLPDLMRLDAISIMLSPEGDVEEIEHVENIT
jgi:putative endonuclease